MNIPYHEEISDQGILVGVHVFHTHDLVWNRMTDPQNAANTLTAIQYIKALLTTPSLIPGTGWGAASNHPLYPGKTKLQALVGEIIRANDAVARTALGV